MSTAPTPEERLLEAELEQEIESQTLKIRSTVRRIIESYSSEDVIICSLWGSGKTVPEIASVTNLPVKKVYSRLAKIQKAVIKEIGVEQTPKNKVLIQAGLRQLVADSLPAPS